MGVTVTYYDGQNAGDRQAVLEFGPAGLLLLLGGASQAIDRSNWRAVPPVGKGDWALESLDGARIIIKDQDAGRRAAESLGYLSFVELLESSWGWACLALVVAAGSVWALLTWGVPSAARHIAFAIPPEIDRKLSEESIDFLDDLLFQPSALAEDRKLEVQRLFDKILEENPDYRNFHLEFRSATAIGANAFAIPGGLVVVTDEMVELVGTEDEIVAVLAHEVGHLSQRHGLRILLQNSSAAIIIASLTGDLSNITALSATVPTILMQANYSREFEREADAFAFAYLRRQGLDSNALSGLLLRLEKAQGEATDDRLTAWFSSHPRSDSRVPEK